MSSIRYDLAHAIHSRICEGLTYNEVRQKMAEEEERDLRNKGAPVEDGKTPLGFISLGLELEAMQ